MIYVTTEDVYGAQTLDDKDSGVSNSSHHRDIDVEKEGEYDEKASTDASANGVGNVADLKGVVTVSGKPDIRKILEDAVTSSGGPVSVDGESLRLPNIRVLICTSSLRTRIACLYRTVGALFLIRFADGSPSRSADCAAQRGILHSVRTTTS